MSVNDENRKAISEIGGSQKPSNPTQKKLNHALKRFKYNFPSLNWWGNTPIEPTGAGLTYAESITWIRHMMHHLSDWVGQMDDELDKLADDLRDIEIIIKHELAEQLPGIIQEYDLFDVIVTGNNENIKLATNQTTTARRDQSVFTYGIRTEYGFIEVTKTNEKNVICDDNNATWLINTDERSGDNVLNFTLLVNNIPAPVNRLWVINKQNGSLAAEKELYFVHNNQIKAAKFSSKSSPLAQSISLDFEKLNTNYEPYWIVNVFKRIPNGKNYLHYMTLDYKVYEYDLETGEETLLYAIPLENQDIFDPIADVIEGKHTIWAVTYRGTNLRYLKEANGLCFNPCFDSVELYDTWETPKKLTFTNDYSGITPANMYQDYANKDESEGDKDLLSAFILSEKTNEYPQVVSFYELSPKNFDNRIVSDNLEKYFDDTILNDLRNNQSLGDYQGFYSYNVTDQIENFKDAPLLLLKDTKATGDGAKVVLENSQFIAEGQRRTYWQRLKIFTPNDGKKRTLRVYERSVEQNILLSGMVFTSFSRWYDNTKITTSEKINRTNTGDKMDYLSLAGTHRTYNGKDYEDSFKDTAVKQYMYYDLPVDKEHPLLQNLANKNVIIETTKGTNYEKNANEYEIVFKLTYQDEYAELQFRRLMRFPRSTNSDKYGGRNRASYVSPWAYVYYTKPDDTAPDGYDKNPVTGIDQEFWDIINNLQEQINNLWEEINNLWEEFKNFKEEVRNEFNDIRNEIKNLKEEINNIYNKFEDQNDVITKILNKLKDIDVWQQTGDTIIEGNFKPGKGIAGGTINIFSKADDSGTYYIRTNKSKTEGDISAGV